MGLGLGVRVRGVASGVNGGGGGEKNVPMITITTATTATATIHAATVAATEGTLNTLEIDTPKHARLVVSMQATMVQQGLVLQGALLTVMELPDTRCREEAVYARN